MGLTWAGKTIVGLNYLKEILLEDKQIDLLVTVIFILTAIIALTIPVIYLTITRSWLIPTCIGFVQALVPAILIPYYLPESPKYLYEQGQYDKARDSLDQIAEFNLVDKQYIAFDKETPEFEIVDEMTSVISASFDVRSMMNRARASPV